MIREILTNVSTGALCRVNLAIAVVGSFSAATFEQQARIFSYAAMGCWFCLQISFALYDRFVRRKRRQRAALD